MTEFTFYLTEEDTDRLYTIKQLQGERELSGNDYAKKLLERELYRMFPAVPRYSDSGELLNPEGYRP